LPAASLSRSSSSTRAVEYSIGITSDTLESFIFLSQYNDDVPHNMLTFARADAREAEGDVCAAACSNKTDLSDVYPVIQSLDVYNVIIEFLKHIRLYLFALNKKVMNILSYIRNITTNKFQYK
jgi:hypothetical protein